MKLSKQRVLLHSVWLSCAVWQFYLISVLRAQFQYCARGVARARHIPFDLKMSGERDVDSSREHFQRFCQDTYISQKKNSKTLSQNRIDAIKAYLKNVTGWQQQVFGEGPVDKAKLANFKCDVSFFLSLRYYYTEYSVIVGCICSGDTLTFPHGAQQVDLRAFAKARHTSLAKP